MPILNSKTAPDRPPRILCSENANSSPKIEILRSENVCTQKCNGALNRPPRILHSENENSALKIEILGSENEKFPQCNRRSPFPAIFHAKSGSSTIFRAAALKFLRSRNPGGTVKIF